MINSTRRVHANCRKHRWPEADYSGLMLLSRRFRSELRIKNRERTKRCAFHVTASFSPNGRPPLPVLLR